MSLELYSTTEALELSLLFSEPKEAVETARGEIRLSPATVALCRNATGISSELNACPLFSLGLTDRFGLFEFRKHVFFPPILFK